MKKLYRGSCHCGAVTFEADIDLAAGTSKCNCSVCSKGRFWKAIVPSDAFRAAEESLADYQFGNAKIQHLFCITCGIKPFGRGSNPQMGEFVAVNVACLDGLSDEERCAIPVSYEDGRYDNYDSPPGATGHL